MRNTIQNHREAGGYFLLKHFFNLPNEFQWTLLLKENLLGESHTENTKGRRDFLEHRWRPGAIFFLTESPQRLLVGSLIKETWFSLGEELPSPGDISQDSWVPVTPGRIVCLPDWAYELSLRPSWDTLPSTLNPIHPLLILHLILEGLLETSHLQFLQNIHSVEWNLGLQLLLGLMIHSHQYTKIKTVSFLGPEIPLLLPWMCSWSSIWHMINI